MSLGHLEGNALSSRGTPSAVDIDIIKDKGYGGENPGSLSPPVSVAVVSTDTALPTEVNKKPSGLTLDIEPDPAKLVATARVDGVADANIDPAIRSSCPSPPDHAVALAGLKMPLGSPYSVVPPPNATINPQSVQGPLSVGLQYPPGETFQASWSKQPAEELSNASSNEKPIDNQDSQEYDPSLASAPGNLGKKPTESDQEHAARYRSQLKLSSGQPPVTPTSEVISRGGVGVQRGKPLLRPAGIVMPGPQIKKKKSHARKQPVDHIPRPRNRFMLFRKHVTDNKLIPPSVEIKHQNVSIIVAKMWAEAPEEVKAEFTEAARIEKDEHARKYPNYRYQPAYRRTDIIRRRVRKDVHEDEKCDAVASLLMKGKVGKKLETEIQEVIGVSKPEEPAEVAVAVAVKTKPSPKRGRRKDAPGELSKGAIRAQKAAVRAKALRDNWADATRLALSQPHHHHQLRSQTRVRYLPDLPHQLRQIPEVYYGEAQQIQQAQQAELAYDPYPQYYEEEQTFEPYQNVQYAAARTQDQQSEFGYPQQEYAPQDYPRQEYPSQEYPPQEYGQQDPYDVAPVPHYSNQAAMQPDSMYHQYDPQPASPHDGAVLTPMRMSQHPHPIYHHQSDGAPGLYRHSSQLSVHSPGGGFELQPTSFHSQPAPYPAANESVPMAWDATADLQQGLQYGHGQRSYGTGVTEQVLPPQGYEHSSVSAQQYYVAPRLDMGQPMDNIPNEAIPLEAFTPAGEYPPPNHFLPDMQYPAEETVPNQTEVSARPRDIIAGQWMKEAHQHQDKLEPLPPADEHRNSIPFMERIEVAGPSQGIDFGNDSELFGGMLNVDEANGELADYHQALRHQQELEARVRAY